MTHGTKPRVCRTCNGILSKGGAFLKCSRCGWTNAPRDPVVVAQRHRAEKMRKLALQDQPPPFTKDEVMAMKRAREKSLKHRRSHFRDWLAKYREAKKNKDLERNRLI